MYTALMPVPPKSYENLSRPCHRKKPDMQMSAPSGAEAATHADASSMPLTNAMPSPYARSNPVI